ncbi:ATP-dependent zinc metalloprotease FtsH [Peredibacter starrii]|uniref:ATP-dependent zinc metalloprotease FtsH n=1 Tax=Peredibacter starrii TaxID=28202 RepID=A0AAX4HV60_9BACT|nr:ATP-dependent zinc metalloprotease FtsH [Peredibacter starrii]WPU66834.1 ATP-dependent zinc metalloprotease FtsH [Peredibacter starrii]
METENNKRFVFSYYHIFLGILAFLIVRSCLEGSQMQRISYSEFKQHLERGDIKNVTLRGDSATGEFVKPIKGRVGYQTNIVPQDIANQLDKYKVSYESLGSSSFMGSFILFFLPTILFIGFWYYILKRGLKGMGGGGSFMSIGKSKAKIYVETDTKTTFKDVAGADEALDELREVIDFLKNADKVKSLGGKMPKGILLVGSPGTGKTLIAKAIAGEAGVPFFSTNGAEFVEMFVGVGAARVRDLFEQAKKTAPCIIFIDELDALGKTRHSNIMGGNDEKEQTLNQLLVEMDGFDTQGGIIILAATNRPEMIDPALLRAGRFDRQVVVDRPDRKGREDILKIHSKKVKMEPDVNLDSIAGLTPGFTGADLANLVNEAALIATRENATAINMNHFTLAFERSIAGIEKKNKILNAKEKEIVAFHEMGHTLVGYWMSHDDKIHKVSIIPHGIGSMGYTIQRPTEDRYLMTKEDLENKMAVLMGGRAAEMLIFGKLSTGASDDLGKATNIAREMVMRFGMTEELGFVTYEEAASPFLDVKDGFSRISYADDTAKEIDECVKRIVMNSYLRAYEFLRNHRELLESAASSLMLHETLSEEELKEFFRVLDDERAPHSPENETHVH